MREVPPPLRGHVAATLRLPLGNRGPAVELRAEHEEHQRKLAISRMVDALRGIEECASDVESALSRGDYTAAVARVAPLAEAIAVTEAGSSSDVADPSIPSFADERVRAAEVGGGREDRRARRRGPEGAGASDGRERSASRVTPLHSPCGAFDVE